MKKISKSTFIPVLFIGLLFCLPLFGGCQKGDVALPDFKCPFESVSGPDDDIVGKWKLVKYKTVFYNPKTIDYSCESIFYHFQSDGTLIISSDVEDMTSPDAGIYSFEFSLSPLHENLEENYTLKIEQMDWACSIDGNSMVLNNTPLDGPALYFVRIQ